MLDAAKLLGRMTRSVDSAKERNAKFAEGFATNALWALENSDRTFSDAAIIDIYERYIAGLLANRVEVSDLREDAMSYIMLAATSGQSTSEVTNLIKRMRVQAYAEVVKWIDGGL